MEANEAEEFLDTYGDADFLIYRRNTGRVVLFLNTSRSHCDLVSAALDNVGIGKGDSFMDQWYRSQIIAEVNALTDLEEHQLEDIRGIPEDSRGVAVEIDGETVFVDARSRSALDNLGVEAVQAGHLRELYGAEAAKLPKGEAGKALRSALRDTFRQRKAALFKGATVVIDAYRKWTGFKSGMNNPTKTNPGVDKAARVFKRVGGALIALDVFASGYQVVTAPPGERWPTAAKNAGRMGGAFAGGRAGAWLGLKVPGPPLVKAAGGLIGGVGGAIYGGEAVEDFMDTLFGQPPRRRGSIMDPNRK